jgi:DNA-binding transcriptional regulator YiaG
VSDSFSPELVKAVEVIIKRTPKDQCGSSLKLLRQHAHLTQKDLGKRFGRNFSTVATWESGKRCWPPGMTRTLLEHLGVSDEILKSVSATGQSETLSLAGEAYSGLDPLLVRHEYFKRTWPHVLDAVKRRAIDSSAADAKLYKEWMRETEADVAALQSRAEPIAVGSGVTEWVTTALKSAKRPRSLKSAESTPQHIDAPTEEKAEGMICDTAIPQDVGEAGDREGGAG